METSVLGAHAPKIQLLRKTSSGIAGTLRNLDHHAKSIAPLVKFLAGEIPGLRFDVWLQGHNVHVLQTFDGRRFVLRPLAVEGKGYVGVSLDIRVSRSLEIPLAQVYADQPGTWGDFSRMLRALAAVPPSSEVISPPEQ